MTYLVPTRQADAPALRDGSNQRAALVIRTTDACGGREESSAMTRAGDRSLPILANPAPQLRFSIIVTCVF
jgi:hypothetical protein